jgi:hypothetical protein
MLDKSLPKILADHCLERVPANKKVWALDIPVTQMPISKLAWQFDIPFWKYGNKKYAITPNQVIKNKIKYKYQYNRIMNSNLKFPIDVAENKKGKWEILDGLHRLVKAKVLRLTKVNVRKISASQLKKLLQ